MALAEKELFERDAKRNVGEELLVAIKSVKAGCYGRQYAIIKNKKATVPDKTLSFINLPTD
ncbi:hypothetical protein [Pseudomonas fluorescens]|uniref:hypothetical protein n=1 Tax=Pseudomonas fluorescens TaxID=294 RepID=UPI00064237FE|nr:hypothetical protein [Pseudomonas fluorescens]